MKLEEHPFVQSISGELLETIRHQIETRDLKRGDVVFEEQSEPDAIYLVLSGKVAFTKSRADGSFQNISESLEGSFFGEVGVFTGERRALGAIARENTRIGRIPGLTVKRIIEDSEPARKILESVILHLKSTTDHYMNDVMRTEKLALVGTMIASILHDFKNPFSVISLGASLIQTRYEDDPKAVQICESIERQIRRMVHMANDLAAFSRGEHAIEKSPVSVDQLFQVFQELNNHFFEHDQIDIRLEGNGVSFEGDQSKLLRVLQNLIGNAIDAIRSSKEEGQIEAQALEEGTEVVITIFDNGPGIPAEIKETFFEPFVTKGKQQGTGLGTAIVKSIIEAHRGTVDFESSTTGTLFTIRLPKKQPNS